MKKRRNREKEDNKEKEMFGNEKISLVNELHAPARRNFPRIKVIVRGYDDLWQTDLADMQAHSRVNRGNKYILTIIDVFSKYAWATPVKTKSAKDVAGALYPKY